MSHVTTRSAVAAWVLSVLLMLTHFAYGDEYTAWSAMFTAAVAATLTVIRVVGHRIGTNERSFWLGLRAGKEGRATRRKERMT